MLGWCWASVVDDGPTSAQHWANASCLLGYAIENLKCDYCCFNLKWRIFLWIWLVTKQTRDVDPMLVKCCACVADDGPTLNQHLVSYSNCVMVLISYSWSGSFDPAVARISEVLGSNPDQVECLSLRLCICMYSAPNTSNAWNMQCSAYCTIHHKEPLKSFDMSRA